MIDLRDGNAQEIVNIYDALIYLVCCEINKTVPKQSRIAQVDLELLYRLAKKHNLLAICCMALEDAGAFVTCDKELVKRWTQGKNKAIRKNIMLDAECVKICDYMEQEGIWYMPLKGIILKDYYPKLGMRQMADNDILYDATYQEKLRKYMLSQGYRAESVGKGNHDVYMKNPVYNFEMHTALYSTNHQTGWQEYYKEIKKRLIPDEDHKYGLHFCDEDLYVYILSHAYKHYSNSGTGIRSLADIYLYLKNKEEDLDWQYIARELKILHLTEYEQQTRQLCKKLFSMQNMKLTDDEHEQVIYYLQSGTYGTLKNSVISRLQNMEPKALHITGALKCRYYIKRLFPDMEHYRLNAPYVYRHKWLIPGYLVFRFFRGIIKKRKQIVNEIKIVEKIK